MRLWPVTGVLDSCDGWLLQLMGDYNRYSSSAHAWNGNRTTGRHPAQERSVEGKLPYMPPHMPPHMMRSLNSGHCVSLHATVLEILVVEFEDERLIDVKCLLALVTSQ